MTKKIKLNNTMSDLFIPDGVSYAKASDRTTHMAIGAHQDDIELMAFHGIQQCFRSADRWFSGVTVTDGRDSPRTGKYCNVSDDEMAAIRLQEQRIAAKLGEYSMQIQLAYQSASIKSDNANMMEDIDNILRSHKPRVLYLHNLFDRHSTHVSVMAAAIQVLRCLPKEDQPEEVYGVEVWGSLDWLPDTAKVILNTSDNEQLLMALLGVFDSQLSGGKRYDLAIKGRNQSNATFSDFEVVDQLSACQFALNLMPLLDEAGPSLNEFANYFVDSFRSDVMARLA